jgi:hypothetical protein
MMGNFLRRIFHDFDVHQIRFCLTIAVRVARFFLVQDTKTGKMYRVNTKLTYQMVIK